MKSRTNILQLPAELIKPKEKEINLSAAQKKVLVKWVVSILVLGTLAIFNVLVFQLVQPLFEEAILSSFIIGCIVFLKILDKS